MDDKGTVMGNVAHNGVTDDARPELKGTAEAGSISPRLSLASTLHQDRYDEGDLAQRIDAFDRRRASTHPLNPRDPARCGQVP